MQTEIDLRCGCSRLLLKRKNMRLEVKCPRCKSLHVITFEQLQQFFQTGVFCEEVSRTLKLEARDLESRARGSKQSKNREQAGDSRPKSGGKE